MAAILFRVNRGPIRRRRLMAWAMLAALLPSLLYLGHWSVRIPVPGTDGYVALGMRAEHEAQTAGGGHGEHCHGDASCTDSPPAPAVNAFALLNESVALLGACGMLILAAGLIWTPRRDAVVVPESPPPRLAPRPDWNHDSAAMSPRHA